MSLISFRLAIKTAEIRVLSQLMQEYLIDHFYIPKGKIFVLPIPVKIDIFPQKIRNNGKIHFIYMGSNAVWQGLSNLFKAFNQIESETDYVLECYGINHPNTKNIYFHEAVSHDQLIDIVSNQIDVVVIPREKNEITETVMPLKYAEAIYLNKYILVTEMKIFHEMKNDKVVFIKNNHVDTLIEGIKSFKDIFQSESNV
ncbi:glycosyltransferase [bacterium]|nr:glycosyltransferase [bacterium]